MSFACEYLKKRIKKALKRGQRITEIIVDSDNFFCNNIINNIDNDI